eukprot:7197564-Pyramimonas_sp.AAC.1
MHEDQEASGEEDEEAEGEEEEAEGQDIEDALRHPDRPSAPSRRRGWPSAAPRPTGGPGARTRRAPSAKQGRVRERSKDDQDSDCGPPVRTTTCPCLQ